MKKTQRQTLSREARRYLAGGVNSPVRSFSHVGGEPLFLREGRGARVIDEQGRTFIDYVLSWGASILGHAHPAVVAAIRQAARRGCGFGTTGRPEVVLAKTIRDAIPFAENIRFTNSGTEAVMGALRLARGFTKRDKVVKFEHAYHGHADYLLAAAGSGLSTLRLPLSAGVPEAFLEDTIVVPPSDRKALTEAFRRFGKQIAAVIVEPIGGNFGVRPPDAAFLDFVRGLTRRYGALLVFDEVITGFRNSYGSAAQELKVTPDLIVLGKAIGAGLPIGVYAGRRRIMRNLAPEGRVYQASTFAGNPLVMQAGIAALGVIKERSREFGRLAQAARALSLGIEQEAQRAGIRVEVSSYGTMFSMRFKKKGSFARFYRRMLEEGVFLAPSEYEADFLSFAHSSGDVQRTLKAVRRAMHS